MGRQKIQRGLYMANKIRLAFPYSFCGGVITGERGIGKSSFALNTVWEVYMGLMNPDTGVNYTEDEAWRMALDSVVFTISDVIEAISKASKSKVPLRALIWDDAGTYCSTMAWWSNRNQLERLKGVLDTVRSGCSGLLLTTPSETDLSKILRNYDDFIIQIRYCEVGGNYRIAKGYLKRTLPSGTRRIYSKFANRFVVRLPDHIFKEYMEHRHQVFQDQVDDLKKNI